jgi:polysaccharide transporter, PST family
MPVAAAIAAIAFVTVSGSRGFEPQAVLTAMVMMPLPFLAMEQTLRSYHEASGSTRTIVSAGISAALIASIFKLTAILAGAQVWVFALAGTIEGLLTASLLIRAIPGRTSAAALRNHVSAHVVRSLTRESWPLLLAGIAVTVYMRVDIVMLGLLAGDQETGIYAAAARLSEVWYFLPVAGMAALRPVLARLMAAGHNSDYNQVLQRFMTGATAVSIVAVLVVSLGAPTIITLLYGDAFSAGTSVLRWHILATPFVFLGVASSPWFIDRGLTRQVLLRSSVGAVINVSLNAILIPPLGGQGAAIATLVSYATSAVLINGVLPAGREVFRMQMRALMLRRASENVRR